jgi:hypothetical protein
MQEVDHEVVANATIVVDHRESAWAEAGDLIIARDKGLITESHIHAEIGEIAAGSKPGRTRTDEVTLFKSVGNACRRRRCREDSGSSRSAVRRRSISSRRAHRAGAGSLPDGRLPYVLDCRWRG